MGGVAGTSSSTGGVAGVSSGMGGVAGTSVSGAGGSAGQSEDDDPIWPEPDFCFEDHTIAPVCYTIPLQGMPLVALQNPRHIALNTVTVWGGWQLVVTERNGHTIRTTWGDDNADVDWRCFDTVAYADRVAGTSMTNDWGEWFVTTECGGLFVRRLVLSGELGGWGPWVPFSLPSARSFVQDIATSLAADGINYVFIVDRGRVYQRHRLGTESASFSAWDKVQAPTSERLAAGLRPDGRQQLFVLDENGEPFTCVQTSTELGAEFEACVDFDGDDVPQLTQIISPYRVAEGSPLLALDVDGMLWTRFQNGVGGYDDWQEFPVAPPERLKSVAGGGLPLAGDPLRVAAIAQGGSVYMIVRRDGAWGTWIQYP
jgi:hypothetical protein